MSSSIKSSQPKSYRKQKRIRPRLRKAPGVIVNPKVSGPVLEEPFTLEVEPWDLIDGWCREIGHGFLLKEIEYVIVCGGMCLGSQVVEVPPEKLEILRKWKIAYIPMLVPRMPMPQVVPIVGPYVGPIEIPDVYFPRPPRRRPSLPHGEGCLYMFVRGQKKGETCGALRLEGSPYCQSCSRKKIERSQRISDKVLIEARKYVRDLPKLYEEKEGAERKVKEIYPDAPGVLSSVMVEYTVDDELKTHVEGLGIVFPPHVTKTSAQQEYLRDNIEAYANLCKWVFGKTPNFEAQNTDRDLIEKYGPAPDGWNSRKELVNLAKAKSGL